MNWKDLGAPKLGIGVIREGSLIRCSSNIAEAIGKKIPADGHQVPVCTREVPRKLHILGSVPVQLKGRLKALNHYSASSGKSLRSLNQPHSVS